MRHIIPISGKDSAATAIVQRELQPELDYEYMFNPTGAELPPVFAWLDKVSAYLGKPIAQVGEDLESIIEDQGILPSKMVRYCTRLSKIYPMENWIGSTPAIVYYGIRADEQRIGYKPNNKQHITPVYPLQQLGLGLMDVWQLLERHDLLPPLFFWQDVYDRTQHKQCRSGLCLSWPAQS